MPVSRGGALAVRDFPRVSTLGETNEMRDKTKTKSRETSIVQMNAFVSFKVVCFIVQCLTSLKTGSLGNAIREFSP